jgi:hypothetical protein
MQSNAGNMPNPVGVTVNASAKRDERVFGRHDIGAFKQAAHFGCANRKTAENQRTMRNGFITRNRHYAQKRPSFF